MNYSKLVGIVGERNRPSGGLRTINTFVREARVSKESRILEIGTNTGFAAVNIALLTGARVVGIDVNHESLRRAKEYASSMGVSSTVDFLEMDGCDTQFSEEEFDAVWVSNVPSFCDSKKKMIEESGRVLRTLGYLGVAPIFYHTPPPQHVIDAVSELVGSKVGDLTLENWFELIGSGSNSFSFFLQNTYLELGKYLDRSRFIEPWVSDRLKSANWGEITLEDQLNIEDDYRTAIELFNENLKFCHYAVTVWQKRAAKDEDELFLTLPLS